MVTRESRTAFSQPATHARAPTEASSTADFGRNGAAGGVARTQALPPTGGAPAERAKLAGLALLWPADPKGDERVRGTTTYPPGAKENGGIFCHANTWAIVAASKLGMAERAMQYTPFSRKDVDVGKVEPYVYCGNIAGPEHKQFGYARNDWLSGTASWTYVAGTQWILGIRPTYRGLSITPVIPQSWKGFKATRVFRGVRYVIEVKRAGKGNDVAITADGKAVNGTVVPLPAEGTEEVEVRLG